MKFRYFSLLLALVATACASDYKGPQAADIPAPQHAVYSEGLIADITPQGWIKETLNRQRNGLTGHPEAMDYPYNSPLWAGELKRDSESRGDDWWRYEQTAYYLDGLTRLGYLTEDKEFLALWNQNLEYVLAHQREDGRLGVEGDAMAWPFAVFFRAMKACYEATGDERIPQALEKHYLSYSAEELCKNRFLVNIEGILWTWSITRNFRLKKLAEAAWLQADADLNPQNCADDSELYMHGVTMDELLKVPVILYEYTGNWAYLNQAQHAYDKMADNNMLIDGVNSSTEHLAGRDALASHETCDISDFSWTAGYFLLATGKGEWADRIERCMFNAALGCVTKDFKTLQYFSCPNQFICTGNSDHNAFKHGTTWMQYRPIHETECCVGNMNRFFPNYVSRMWLKDRHSMPVAALYGPSEMIFDLGEGLNVLIEELTEYPFEEKIDFRFTFYRDGKECNDAVDMDFSFRVPDWCSDADYNVEGEEKEATGAPTVVLTPGFHTVSREWKSGEVLSLTLPMKPVLEENPVSGVSVTMGPIVYSYAISDETTIDYGIYDNLAGKKSGNPEFVSLSITPAAPWNYALVTDNADDIEVVRNDISGYPFDGGNSPVTLRVKACEVPGWELEEGRYTPALPQNVSRNAGRETVLDLVPYGSTTLRLTVFPKAE